MKNRKVLSMLGRLMRLRVSFVFHASAAFKRNVIPTIVSALAITIFDAVAANAATAVKTDTDLSPFIGCFDVGWLKPLAPFTNSITGKLITVGVIVGVVFVIINGIKLIVAGSRVDRAQDSLMGIKHVVMGLVVVSAGIVLLIGIIPLLFVGLCA